ncbi:MAG: transcription elongation factor GreAB [Verrucomicrobia bacterium]|nr:transcription elongation factor GreAB [Verrucomicrobiota bacterium]|tara:strand:- start:153 stop:572 length:420 start_codon:yes stop_codon:yes gene_type:complete
MKYGNITIEKKDFVYLKSILKVAGFDNNRETRDSLQKLESELQTAIVVDEQEMPEDVIRFNSKISLNIDGNQKFEVQLVKPALKDLEKNRISILTPMGSALIGYAKGDQLMWKFPNGLKKITILEVAHDNLYAKERLAV